MIGNSSPSGFDLLRHMNEANLGAMLAHRRQLANASLAEQQSAAQFRAQPPTPNRAAPTSIPVSAYAGSQQTRAGGGGTLADLRSLLAPSGSVPSGSSGGSGTAPPRTHTGSVLQPQAGGATGPTSQPSYTNRHSGGRSYGMPDLVGQGFAMWDYGDGRDALLPPTPSSNGVPALITPNSGASQLPVGVNPLRNTALRDFQQNRPDLLGALGISEQLLPRDRGFQDLSLQPQQSLLGRIGDLGSKLLPGPLGSQMSGHGITPSPVDSMIGNLLGQGSHLADPLRSLVTERLLGQMQPGLLQGYAGVQPLAQQNVLGQLAQSPNARDLLGTVLGLPGAGGQQPLLSFGPPALPGIQPVGPAGLAGQIPVLPPSAGGGVPLIGIPPGVFPGAGATPTGGPQGGTQAPKGGASPGGGTRGSGSSNGGSSK